MTCCVKPPCVSRSFPSIPPLPNPHALALILRHYVQSSLHLFDRSNIAKQNLSHRANVICDGSPSRMRMVRRISLGITTRPRSSILLTIPVAFISSNLSCCCFFMAETCSRRSFSIRQLVMLEKIAKRKLPGNAMGSECETVFAPERVIQKKGRRRRGPLRDGVLALLGGGA